MLGGSAAAPRRGVRHQRLNQAGSDAAGRPGPPAEVLSPADRRGGRGCTATAAPKPRHRCQQSLTCTARGALADGLGVGGRPVAADGLDARAFAQARRQRAFPCPRRWLPVQLLQPHRPTLDRPRLPRRRRRRCRPPPPVTLWGHGQAGDRARWARWASGAGSGVPGPDPPINAYVPNLQVGGHVVSLLTAHLGYPMVRVDVISTR
jgi:hypothetical protein